jgi:O-acetyl-ADP-ribose deacetylase (regulator of RNase III)
MIFNVGYTEVEIKKGDLTAESADAIVNAANTTLVMGGGVAAAIREFGGSRIQEEAAAKGPVPVGAAVATNAGNLYARYVIHGAVMGTDFRTDARLIRQTMESVLDRADELAIKTIAFPAFGTGVGRFPPNDAAGVMLSVLQERIKLGTSLQKVTFVLWTDEIVQIFETKARQLFGEPRS